MLANSPKKYQGFQAQSLSLCHTTCAEQISRETQVIRVIQGLGLREAPRGFMLPRSPIQGLATMWSPIPATKWSCQHVIYATHAQIFWPNIKEWGGEMQSYHFHGSKRKVRIFVNKPNDHHDSFAIVLLPMLSCLCTTEYREDHHLLGGLVAKSLHS